MEASPFGSAPDIGMERTWNTESGYGWVREPRDMVTAAQI
jgi:hypothetical protein